MYKFQIDTFHGSAFIYGLSAKQRSKVNQYFFYIVLMD